MLIYVTYPFVNGLGCDFTADVEDEQRAVHAECFAGNIIQIYREKTTGKTFTTHSIYGRRGDTIFMILLDVEYLDLVSSTQPSQLYDYIHMPRVMSFKLFESAVDDDDIVLWDSPIMKIYKIKRVGRLSWK